MKILYVVPTAGFFLSHRLPLALAARRAGHEVHVGTSEDGHSGEILKHGLRWHRVRFGPLRRKPWSDLETAFDLVRLVRRVRPDLLHAVTFKAVLYGTIAARLGHVASVVNAMTGLGDVFDARTATDRFWVRLTITLFRCFVRHPAMRVIFQNPDDLHLMVDAGAVDKGQTVLIRGSGVDPSWYVPTQRRRQVPVVMFVGRLVSTKGIHEFVSAAEKLRSEGIVARFVVAGEIDRESGRAIASEELERWKSRAGIEYAGFVADARKLYAEADVVCLPSYRVEGLPKALLEAASCALPIVTTDVPGNREIVREGENGLLVPVRDVDALGKALAKLVENRELRERMGRRGREFVIENFSLETVVSQTLAVYELLAPAGISPVR